MVSVLNSVHSTDRSNLDPHDPHLIRLKVRRFSISGVFFCVEDKL